MKEKLLELRSKIDRAKMEVARLTGERDVLLKELRSKWACKTVEEAEKRLDALDEEIEQVEREIEQKIEHIKQTYPQAWS